jgi:SPP1 family predicted phage head-tail adaptor
MVLNAGRLDRRVRLERRTLVQNVTGEAIEIWVLLAEIWAEKRDLRGREFIAARAEDAEAETFWRIRYRGDVTPHDTRLVHDGAVHDIVSVAELGRREALELVTRRP